MRRSKYGAIRVEIDGHTFHSKLEGWHYGELKIRQRIGEISNLELQPKFPIIINGTKICTVIGDFSYLDTRKNRRVVTDSKGFQTPMSKLKMKLVKACYPDIEWNIVK
jgi:hypothetical protein